MPKESAAAKDVFKAKKGEARIPLKPFEEKLERLGALPLKAAGIEVLQVNLGKLCNQRCKHCHVEAGPDRQEIMARKTMESCLKALRVSTIPTVDITGGCPELNPNFEWFVEESCRLRKHVIVRSNLTVLVEEGYEDLPRFFAEEEAEIIGSLPYYLKENTDAVRGPGTFDKSIKALRQLNEAGYGKEDSGLVLNLVCNAPGAYLPPAQASIERDFKKELLRRHGIVFNNLFTITNMPIGRFLNFLQRSGNYERYMKRLIDAFNPEAVPNVMCSYTVSVGWDGTLYDCDFNQMLNMGADAEVPIHIKDFDAKRLSQRTIKTGLHCYGCTAGAGSSCRGALAE